MDAAQYSNLLKAIVAEEMKQDGPIDLDSLVWRRIVTERAALKIAFEAVSLLESQEKQEKEVKFWKALAILAWLGNVLVWVIGLIN